MGAADIDGQTDAAIIDPSSQEAFKHACKLLFLDPAKVEEGLTIKYSTAGLEVVKGRWHSDEGMMLLQSLAKAMYDKLFYFIVKRLNSNIAPTQFKSFMAMLDIFGFEVFESNSLEQLFINITNEMLQKNFIDVIFDRELKLYRAEGISAANLEWTTNAEIIEALTAKKASLMTSIEDQCLAPGGADDKIISSAVGQVHTPHTKLYKAKVNPNENFVVAHTIGDIQYNVKGFILKNKDILRAELVEVVQASTDSVANTLFEGVVMERGKLAKGQLIGSQFLTQLTDLMAIINSTEPHFIRCVKPNEEKAPLKYTSSKVLVQLHALSILEALQLRQLGYSYRRPFSEFVYQFRFIDLGVAEDKKMAPVDAARQLLERAALPQGEWQIGKTMVFMKQSGTKMMSNRQREALAAWEPLISAIESTYYRKQRAAQMEHYAVHLTRFQAHARRRLAVKH
eukprot:GHVO01045643.1.p1 GENE.GHVO01045643.1~~GHVO01045643.1.p1  ORF type:complete len:510 (-),score=126.45 GHVO01045643.1:14-1375(-)